MLNNSTLIGPEGDPSFQALLLEGLPYHLWVLGDAETLLWGNRLLADFLGLDVAELVHRPLSALFAFEEHDLHLELNRQGFAGCATVESREWFSSPEQGARLLAIKRTPLCDTNGRVQSLLCTASDITEEHLLRERIRKHEANFRAFIEALEDIVLIGDFEGRVVFANQAAVDKLGYSREEMRTHNILDFHPAASREEAQAILKDILAGKRTTCPLPIVTREGRVISVETRVNLGQWDGKPVCFGLMKDLSTEQESLQRFDRLFRSNPTPMVLSSVPDMSILDINESLLSLLGYTAEEMIGKTPQELRLMVHEEPLIAAAMEVIQKGSVHDIELVLRTKDDRHVDSLFMAELVQSQNDKYFLAVLVDITERKAADRRRDTRIEELSSALAEAHTLSGILPICASCKRVRDEQGHWEQIDAYLAKHSDLLFSHGLCPLCSEAYTAKLEGDLELRRKRFGTQ